MSSLLYTLLGHCNATLFLLLRLSPLWHCEACQEPQIGKDWGPWFGIVLEECDSSSADFTSISPTACNHCFSQDHHLGLSYNAFEDIQALDLLCDFSQIQSFRPARFLAISTA